MKPVLFKLIGRASDLIDVQPVLALFLGGALLTVFLVALLEPARSPGDDRAVGSLPWALYRHLRRFLWAITLASLVLAALSLLRVYLHQTLAQFQRSHGRITEANYNAVQTIWGPEQDQGDLHVELYYEQEETERIESEDLTKPAILRKKVVRHTVTENPFLAEHHAVALRQNARKKGSALYGGYETDCDFLWKLQNPSDRELHCVIKFPLPAPNAMYDALTARLNGTNILSQIELKDGYLCLSKTVAAKETLDLALSFKSRGMTFWYWQVKEPREIRDFTLALTLPDLAKARLNYPEGCMTPTDIKPTPDGQGSALTFRLDHAISGKGMGIALPTIPQPGATTNAVLTEVERGWLLTFAMLLLTFGLGSLPRKDSDDDEPIGAGKGVVTLGSGVLRAILLGAATACAYGLLADFSDLLFGFWGAAVLILVPLCLALAWLGRRLAPAGAGRFVARQLMLFGIIYPALAGLDNSRQLLYFDLCAAVFLACAAWLLAQRWPRAIPETVPAAAT